MSGFNALLNTLLGRGNTQSNNHTNNRQNAHTTYARNFIDLLHNDPRQLEIMSRNPINLSIHSDNMAVGGRPVAVAGVAAGSKAAQDAIERRQKLKDLKETPIALRHIKAKLQQHVSEGVATDITTHIAPMLHGHVKRPQTNVAQL